MMISIKTKSWNSSLGDNFPSLRGIILLFPVTDRRFYKASWFSRCLPCRPTQFLQPPFCVCGQWCSHFHPQSSWLLPPWSPQFLGVLSSSFCLLPTPRPGFSAQPEKIRLISDVPSMLLEKPFIPLISPWLPFSFPTPGPSDSSSLANFPTWFSPPPSQDVSSQIHVPKGRRLSTQTPSTVSLWILTCLSQSPGACNIGSITLILGRPSVRVISPSCHSGTLFPKLFLSHKSLISASPLYTANVRWPHKQPTFILPFYPFKLPPSPMFCLQTSWKTHFQLLSMLQCRFSSLKSSPSDRCLPPTECLSTTPISLGWCCRNHHAWEDPTLPFSPSPSQVLLPL